MHADEQQPELADAERQPDEQEPAPGDGGAAHEQDGGEGGGDEAQAGEEQRGQRVETDVDDDEVHAPDGGDHHRGGDVARFHMADAGLTYCLEQATIF